MDVIYREVQSRKPLWMWAVVGGIALLAWALFMVQVVGGRPVGSKPAPDPVVWVLAVICGIFVPLMTHAMRLIVEVTPAEVRVRFIPVWSRRIPVERIVRAEARRYRPIAEYGGWGIRYGMGQGWAWTLAGTEGVQLELEPGGKLLIGSEHAEELARAIRAAAGLA